ncbi:MAG TPA: hypothetical protein PLF81_26335 [Candidatus Anammoximicrobium sp.]|nr:hypothetical protein [Candidatus Anammoximicrobium sp.]
MKMKSLNHVPWPVLISLLIGCGETDPRVVQVALESTRRQAEQNKQMADLQQRVAEGTKQLVDADAQARQQLAELQRELRSDQAEVGRQRDALESERRTIASERRWDSILGTSIYAGAGILACLLPLLLCGWLLHATRDKQGTDEALAELLVEELVTDRPLLLPPRQSVPLLEHPSSTRPTSAPNSDPNKSPAKT